MTSTRSSGTPNALPTKRTETSVAVLPDTVAARKLKKRELDRKAQRMARERTKNRIAYLEDQVETLQSSGTNAELSRLAAEVARLSNQRDQLLRVLRSFQGTIRRHLEPSPSSAASPNPTIDVPTDGMDVSWAFPSQTETAYANGLGDEMIESTIAQPYPVWSGSLPGLDDPIIPRPQAPCPCTLEHADLGASRTNTWRAANKALGKHTKLSPAQLAVEDYTSQDTPIRVVLEGWDSVQRAGKMSMSWQKLRQIDETCFPGCGQTERLAILTMMHALLTYHGDPTPEKRNALPRWFWTRPSQAVAHSYAIDFFVWPGVRERFVFSQHQYCTNLFWDLFQTSFKIRWPLPFSQCYAQDADTGQLLLTSMFKQRIRDINAWSMTQDFFAQFPDLCEDIPRFQTIPPQISTVNKHLALSNHRHHQRDAQDELAVWPMDHTFITEFPTELPIHGERGEDRLLDGLGACGGFVLDSVSSWPSI